MTGRNLHAAKELRIADLTALSYFSAIQLRDIKKAAQECQTSTI